MSHWDRVFKGAHKLTLHNNNWIRIGLCYLRTHRQGKQQQSTPRMCLGTRQGRYRGCSIRDEYREP